jgi:predicted Zn-dependent protease
MQKRTVLSIALAIVFAVTLWTAPVRAQKFSLIRDAEIENTIRTFATPLFQAAGLAPDAVSIHLVNDDSLNAFVAGGQNLFVHTGLLIRSDSANQVIGVIAHETGHISGGHLSRTGDAIETAMMTSLIGSLLSAGAAVLSGRGDVAAAGGVASQSMAMRNFMAFSRTQESSADAAALRFLEATEQSARGFLEFFEILGEQELLTAAQQDPYVRTHPLSRDRVDTVRTYVAKSRFSDVAPNPAFTERHARMKAKLIGFTKPLPQTLRTYPETDRSVAGRYARAIGYYRVANMSRALALIDELIAEQPNDPYFHEMRGQMLFENQRGVEAIPSYERAVALSSDSALLHAELAHAQIEVGDPSMLESAISHLQFALARDPRDSGSWRFLATAYGRQGKMGESSRALAEEALLKRRYIEAIGLAKRAQAGVKSGSPDWIRAGDIIAIAEDEQKKLKQR